MKIAHVILSLGLSTLAATGTVWATEAGPSHSTNEDPGAWSIRTYQLGNESQWGRGKELNIPWSFSSPKLNPRATHSEIVKSIRAYTKLIRPEMEKIGVPVPEGTLIFPDRRAGLAAVRTTHEAHMYWEQMAQEAAFKTPALIQYQFDLIEVETALASPMLGRLLKHSDHSPILAELTEPSSSRDSHRLKSMTWIAKSGERVNTESMVRSHVANGNQITTERGLEPDQDVPGSGLQIEMESVLSPDRQTIAVNLRMNHASNQSRIKTLDRAPDGIITVEDRFRTEIQTATTLIDGRSRMVGTWKSETPGWRTMAFLTASVVLVQPNVVNLVGPWLREHGEAVLPTPPDPAKGDAGSIPAGMSLRRYQVPPDFLSMGTSPAGQASSDPFASTNANASQTIKYRTAKEVLESMGIPLPEGSHARFIRPTSVLEVVTTDASHDLIHIYTSGDCGRSPLCIDLALRIVEADASLIRDWTSKAKSTKEHQAAWEALKNQGTSVGDYFITTKSGQRVSLDSGFQHHSSSGAPADEDDPDNAAKNDTEMTTHTVGLFWELDPVVGADGQTLDLNMVIEFDTAPPTEEIHGDQQIVRFFEEALLTSLTTISGQTHLIAAWTPEELPNHEKRNVMHAAFLEARAMDIETEHLGPIDEAE